MSDTPEEPEDENLAFFPRPEVPAEIPAREQQRIMERYEFLEHIANGQQPLHAAFAVGWTPATLRKEMNDQNFADLVADATHLVDETVVGALLRQAKAGNMTAIQFWLLNRQPTKWRDVKRVEVQQTTSMEIGVVHSITEAARRLLEEHGPQALQPGGALDIMDAEVVDGD